MIRKFTYSLILIAFAFSAKAQLSGTYTIGGSSPDYASITAAKNDLLAQGVSGPVVFNIRDGVYNEQVLFTSVTGASATNTITFQSENGDSTLVSWEFPSNTVLNPNYTLGLNGGNYFVFSKLTIRRTGTNNSARVVEFLGSGSNNTISSCVLTNEIIAGSSPTSSIIGSNSGTVDNGNTISHCLINGGSFGIYWYGGSTTGSYEVGNIISNNIISNQTTRGVFLNYQDLISLVGNEISTNATSTTYYGLSCSSNNRVDVIKNKINCPAGGYGIQLQSCAASAGNEGVIANNFITVQGTGNAYGINLNTVGYYNVYYNSINISSTDPNNGRGLWIQNTGTNNLNILNNCFANSGGGYAIYFDAITNLVIAQMNNNNIYTSGTNEAYYNFTVCNSLTTWQTNSGLDANSVSFNPQYVSLTDLHMPPVVVNDFGTPVTGITDDIDGETRNAFSPDLGADEYAPFSEDLSVLEIFEPASAACGSDSSIFAVVVKNFGFTDQTNFNIVLDITGAFIANETFTYTGTLLAGQKDTVVFTTALNTLAGGIITVTSYSSLTGDQYNLNDTVFKTVTYYGIPASPVMSVPNPNPVCANNPVTLDGTVGPTEDILFFDAPSGGNLIHVGHPWNTQFPATTTVYAEARSVTSGTPCLRFTEVELNDVGGEGDYIEVQNLTINTIDATGWVIASSDSYTDINLVGTTVWNLDIFAAGEVKYRCDACSGSPNYWGANLLYASGQPGWVIMIDNTGAIVDFMAWGWDSTAIQNMNITVNGFPITIGSEWLSTGAPSCSGAAISRLGTSDNDVDADWACEPNTKGLQNTNITNPFAACGLGICGSERVAVTVNVTGIAVNLGNDTVISFPNTVTLDAGAGFTTYNWSNGSTSQTIVVSTSGTYIVTVTDANGCTSSDAIVVTVFTGTNELFADNIGIHPNPVKDMLIIEFGNISYASELNISLIDISGRVLLNKVFLSQSGSFMKEIDMRNIADGVYTIKVLANESVYQQRVIKQ